MIARRLPPVIVCLGSLAACGLPKTQGPPQPSPTPPPIPTDIVDTAIPEVSGQPQDNKSLGSSVPFVPIATRLTEPGCCPHPFWSADGQEVCFIDQPQPAISAGIYGVKVNTLAGGARKQLISEQVGLPSPDGHYITYLSDSGETIVESLLNGEKSTIFSDGQRVFFSPNSLRLAWADVDRSGKPDEHRTAISISGIDGQNAQEVSIIYGGGIAGWLDDDRLLLVGMDRSGSPDMALFSFSVLDGTRVDLTRNQRIRSVRIAPGGAWILYSTTSSLENPDNNGLWVISANGAQRYKLDVIGSARWRDATRLLIIPLDAGIPSHRLWQFDAVLGQATPLTDPEQTPFRVAAGDWSVSPTGEHVVFLNEKDHALWLLTLPPRP